MTALRGSCLSGALRLTAPDTIVIRPSPPAGTQIRPPFRDRKFAGSLLEPAVEGHAACFCRVSSRIIAAPFSAIALTN
jgi:hypothetical protein